MAEPIVPSSLFQQAMFETYRAAARSAQQPAFGPDYSPVDNMAPTSAPYILYHLANGNNI